MNALENEKPVRCSLCGAEFVPSENTCGGCVMHEDCRLVCCPNCGFGMPVESKLAGWIKRRIEKKGSG